MNVVPPRAPVYPPELYTSRVRYALSAPDKNRAFSAPRPAPLLIAARLFLSLSHNWKRHMPPSVTYDARFSTPSACLTIGHNVPKILAFRRDWAAETGWIASIANLSPMPNEVDVHGMTPTLRYQRLQRLVGVFGGYL